MAVLVLPGVELNDDQKGQICGQFFPADQQRPPRYVGGTYRCASCGRGSLHRIVRFDPANDNAEVDLLPMQCACGDRRFIYAWER